jgi:uncharacterized protein (DUF697 family)/GTP-binding protein EngB required for normal cell division
MDEATRAQSPLNMILAGRPGSGKSTLVNAIFGRRMAETGIGASVTTEIKRHTWPGFPIAIYDTPGIELGLKVEEVKQGYLNEIRKNAPSSECRIHFAVYCVGDLRFLEFEKEIVQSLAKEVSTFLVLTQCPSPTDKAKLELAGKIEALQLPIQDRRVFLTLAEPLEIAGLKLPPFGLELLVTRLHEVLPEAAARTLVSYQRVSLALKVEEAQKLVDWATAITTGMALEPIPIVDAVVISGAQLIMLGKITTVMGLQVDIKAVMTGIASILGVSLAAQQIARQIWKMIPVAGTVISAGMSAAITRKMGQAYVTACSRIIQRKNNGEHVATDDVTTEIIKELRRIWGK